MCNESAENRSQFGIFEIVRNAIEVRNLRDKSACVRSAQITHEPALRNGRIDFENDAEYGIGKRQSRTACLWLGRYETGAKISEQRQESVLFGCLSFVVNRPVLRVGAALCFGNSDALCDRRAAVLVLFALYHETHSVDVLALDAACFMVGASAGTLIGHNVDLIFAAARLRWNEPNTLLLGDDSGSCQFHSALFSQVHVSTLNRLHCSYKVAYCQERFFDLTCSYIKPTLWPMSKPKRKARAAKSETIRFRASAEEKEALEGAAKRNGLALSAWIRQSLLREAGVLPGAK